MMNDDKGLGASADADRATDAPHGAASASPPSGSVSTGAGAFTPGPWRTACEGDSKHRTLVSANAFGTAGEKNGGIYVAVAQGPDNLANARLIAASPDLFDALDEMQRLASDIPAMARNERFGALRMKALAALSKARGA